MKNFSWGIVLVMALAACGNAGGPAGNAAENLAQNAPEDKRESTVPAPLDAAAVHADVLVLDAHADIEIPGKPSRYAGEDGLSKVAPDKMRAGGVDAVVMAIAVGPGPRNAEGYAAAQAKAAEELAAVQVLAEMPGVTLARSADDVVAAHERGDRALILGFQNALILGPEVERLDDFYADGVRVFALTHMGHNDYADSSRPNFVSELGRHEAAEEHGGLSALGEAAIRLVNTLGGVVDVTQLSMGAVMDVLEITTAPVIASHSNVHALSNATRNLTDEEIDAIAAGGGVIHVAPFRGYLYDSSDHQLDADIRAARRAAGVAEDYLYPFELYWEMDDPEVQATFLSTVSELLGPGSIDAMLNHIDYIIDRVGADHVGIGTDFNHGSGIAGFNDASEAMNVTAAMLERGYTPAEIGKIWGGNFLRVMREAERLATH